MHVAEILIGFASVLTGQAIQIAYHHYHDKRQNEYLKRIADSLEKG